MMIFLWYLLLLLIVDVAFLIHSLQSTKQLKLVPFPNIELDTDVTMSEAEPMYPNIYHSRLPSGASSISSSASDSPILGIRTHVSCFSNMAIHIYMCVYRSNVSFLRSLPASFIPRQCLGHKLWQLCSISKLFCWTTTTFKPFYSPWVRCKIFSNTYLLSHPEVFILFAGQFRANCTQIPKLKIACASSVNGHRTMWSHCENCGAISVVECDWDCIADSF